MSVKKTNERNYCGNCCWFCFECTDGDGQCVLNENYPGGDSFRFCSDVACDKFISILEKRHYMAVLLQANRYRRDQNVPAIYKMPKPKELGLAIDFAYIYIKTFSRF